MAHAIETSGADLFRPIGNRGWWPRGSARASFDQQPIEAGSVVLAAEAAFAVRAAPADIEAADRAYAWFLGANNLGLSVADPANGGCHDGLGPWGLNPNQGAEFHPHVALRGRGDATASAADPQPAWSDARRRRGCGQAATYASTSLKVADATATAVSAAP